MKIPFYQVDAFTSRLFAGNPAGVCPLPEWLDDATMQSIAAENNLSETAFFVPRGDRYDLRWMTPEVEVDLCGHATLATAFVVFHHLSPERDAVAFDTQSGELVVRREGDLLAMDFPARPPLPLQPHERLVDALGTQPVQVLASRDYLVVYHDEEQVRTLQPDMDLVSGLDRFAVIVTAPGRDCDFVSRFFAPAQGVNEDPVTGSAHCTLVPYWAKRLHKSALHARQVSARGGELFCEDQGERVKIAGRAVLYLKGEICV
ncbi:MAG: PhzF family phenazine biosynthesis protein [Acidobacteria bacterium]|nr:PhzF family phenazine biosynthesis protein [Acidobacteriota bacterium]